MSAMGDGILVVFFEVSRHCYEEDWADETGNNVSMK